MFFFFFFENIYRFSVIKKALEITCLEKLATDGYCNMDTYISFKYRKNEWYRILSKSNSPLSALYSEDTHMPTEDTIESVFELVNEKYLDKYNYNEMTDIESNAVLAWIFSVYPNRAKKMNAVKALASQFEKVKDVTLETYRSIIYVSDNVEIEVINSVDKFCKYLSHIKSSNQTLFFRGHSNINYKLSPSLYRKDSWMHNEHRMYNELIIECPQDFKDCQYHLEYLVEMQHYGLPTRMLDITKNPLVALYFACCSQEKTYGEVIIFNIDPTEIKYPRSDLVTILSSLPLLSFESKQEYYKLASSTINIKDFNDAISMLLHEVRTEKPAFKDHIAPRDLLRNVFVYSLKSNRRIIKQEGAFILTGLSYLGTQEIDRYDLNGLRYTESGKKQIIIVDKKSNILKQLELLGITKATMFPEIDDVADYIREQY